MSHEDEGVYGARNRLVCYLKFALVILCISILVQEIFNLYFIKC